MKQIILGTAGHIDHGKTSLIKALTGVNTDRLKEEQARGITIELGFADMVLPGGQHLGVVDVPGHEKFVKNMVAGASGIDIVMLVIAADEGVMPQTREHLEICSLLDVKYGLVALTKIDMVDEEWLELVRDDVEQFTADTFLEGAPVVPVSSVSKEGLDDLNAELEKISAQVPPHSPAGLFRLPVDRVFTMKGFGTVITGTLISGKVAVGDNIMVNPTGITSKVRGVQVHGHSRETAEVGARTAINFQGLDRESVQRGEVVSHPGELKNSYMLDAEFQYLQSNKKPIRNRTRLRFHAGTAEIMGLLALIDRDELEPGQRAAVQLRLDQPVNLVRDDHFVVRSYSPVRTIGGGRILNPIPIKHKRFREASIETLQQLISDDPEALIAHQAAALGYRGVAFADLRLMTNLSDKKLSKHLQALLSSRTLVQTDKENRIFVHGKHLERLKQETQHHLDTFHQANPLKQGMLKEELKSKFPPYLGGKMFHLVLQQLITEGSVAQDDKLVRRADHKVSLGLDQSQIRDKMVATYRQSGLTPPYFRELVKTLEVDADTAKSVLMLLVEEKVVVRTRDDLYFYCDAIEDLKTRLVDYLTANEEISTPQFKEMTGVSRKFVIPLIEYFDANHITIRIGDNRRLRKAGGK